jgi:uncharacterized ParB-like nuclease family protein
METDLAGKAEKNLPTARYNSIINILDNFTGEVGVSEDVKGIVNTAVGSPATVDEYGNPVDATGVYKVIADLPEGLTSQDVTDAIDEVIKGLPAGLDTQDVTSAINTALGSPASVDENGNPVDATGVYKVIADLPEGLSTTDVNTAITTALADLNDLSTSDVSGIVNTAVGSPATVDEYGNPVDATGVYKVIADLPEGLTSQDVTDAIDEVIKGLPAGLDTQDVTSAINTALGSPASVDENGNPVDATGVYKVIADLPEGLSTTDVNTAITTALADLNDLSTE